LKNKEPSPSQSIERTFSFAYFAYAEYNLEKIFDQEDETILEFFHEEDEEEFVQVLNTLIKRSFTPLKLENFNEFKKILQAREVTLSSTNMKLLMSIDHIYTKILVNVLLKFEQPSFESVFVPLKHFV
jgi:hypothetical protein